MPEQPQPAETAPPTADPPPSDTVAAPADTEATLVTATAAPVTGGEMPVTAGAVPAELSRRFAALLVDWVLCSLIAGFFGPLPHNPWPPLVLIVEYAFFIGLFGQTPGMRLSRIRCLPDGGTGTDVIGVPRAALRGLLLCLVIPGLIMDGRRRGLHDRAAGSMAVSA